MSDTSQPFSDLTSILTLLENGFYNSQESPDFEEIERRLDDTVQWLSTTVLPAIVKEKRASCVEKVKQLCTVVRKVKKQTAKTNSRLVVACRVCGEVIVWSKDDFWDKMQDHSHIEELWVKYLKYGQLYQNDGTVVSEKMPQEVPEAKRPKYDDRIEIFCYPQEFMNVISDIDGMLEYSIQFRGNGYTCLLCNTPNLAGPSIMEHVHDLKHKSALRDDSQSRAILHSYHSHFTQLPPKFQTHLAYFNPYKVEQATCMLCTQHIDYALLEQHILCNNHKMQIIRRLEKKKYMERDGLLLQACRVYRDDSNGENESPDLSEECELRTDPGSSTSTLQAASSSSSSSSSRDYYTAKEVGSRDEFNSEQSSSSGDRSSDRPAVFKFNFTIPEDAPEEIIPPPPLPEQKHQYHRHILNVCYPERVMSACRAIDGVGDFVIQFASATYASCLLCGCTVEARLPSIKTHLRGTRHQKNARDPDRLIALATYHRTFMQQPYALQLHLTYFCPFSFDEVECWMCGRRVQRDDVEGHVMWQWHEEGIMGRLDSGFCAKQEALLRKAAQIYRIGGKEESAADSPTRNGGTDASNKNATAQQKIVHDIVKSVSNTEATTSLFEKLGNRFRSHLNLLEETPTAIHCKCCDTNILKTLHEIKKHLISDDHKKKAGVAGKKYKYYCDICNSTYSKEISYQEHLNQPAHKIRCEELPPARQKLAEYECNTCSVIFFGDSVSVRKHQMHYKGKNKKNKVIVLSDNVKIFFKSEDYMNEMATRLVLDANSVVTAHEDKVWACCRALEIALSKIFPNCQAHPFGSRVSGLGNQNSDLDVFVDIGDMYMGHINQDAKSQEIIVKNVCKVFKAFPGKVFTHINPIPTARTPIIQVYHTLTQLDCDLSFRHGLSVENTKFLRVCISLQPISQPLILMLKRWLQFSRLSEHITAYALSMMAIFYLQVKGHLLSVKQLRAVNPEPSLVIDGWETINYTLDNTTMSDYITPYRGTLKQLLIDFFKFYADFNYSTDVVCPLLGDTILKSSFHTPPTGDLLPPEMQSYVLKLKTEKEPEFFRALSPFCIQDPFDLSHNLTKACSNQIVMKLKTLCELTVKHLETIK